MVELETGSRDEAMMVAIVAGGGALAVQLVLTGLFKTFGGKVVAKDPGFLAHQVIALVFMVVMFFVGSARWFGQDSPPSTAFARIFEPDSTSRWLSAIAFGELVLWDIPCGTILVPSLRDPLMFGHHVAMAWVAYIGFAHLPSHYYLFFMGVTELSSIPLAIVDIFHPNKMAALTQSSKGLAALNEVARISFVLLFLSVRALYFPYVVLVKMTPDIIECFNSGSALVEARKTDLYVILVSALGLTVLQLYWATLVIKQVSKLLFGSDEKKEKKEN